MALLLLDFDGVINSLSRNPCLDELGLELGWDNPMRYQEIQVHKFISHDIKFSPDLVKAINEWSEQEGNNVLWASSWDENTELFTELGFHEFGFISTSEPNEWAQPGDWFSDKIGSAKEGLEGLLKEGSVSGPVAWVDDDFKEYPKVLERIQNAMPDVNFFPTDMEEGITGEMWENILEVLTP